MNIKEVNGISHPTASHSLALDTRVYSLEAIKKAAYKFADRASILIKPSETDSSVEVLFTFAGDYSERTIADYCNELLDQDLREIVKRETTPLRNLILAHALSKTSLVE